MVAAILTLVGAVAGPVLGLVGQNKAGYLASIPDRQDFFKDRNENKLIVLGIMAVVIIAILIVKRKSK